MCQVQGLRPRDRLSLIGVESCACRWRMPILPDMTRQTLIADLCCGGGLAADGYAAVFGARAIHGFDLYEQPCYPYPFAQADVVDLLASDRLEQATALHTSFPCQLFTTGAHLRTAQGGTSRFLDLLTPGLAALRARWSHKPWIVENVEDNRGLVRKIMAPQPGEYLTLLCGSMFGLQVQRHRLFLTNFPVRTPPPLDGPGLYRAQGCDHSAFPPDPVTGRPRPWGVYHVKGDQVPSGGRTALSAEHAREVMGSHRSLPWDVVKEGFPPAYTSWVGADLLRHLANL